MLCVGLLTSWWPKASWRENKREWKAVETDRGRDFQALSSNVSKLTYLTVKLSLCTVDGDAIGRENMAASSLGPPIKVRSKTDGFKPCLSQLSVEASGGRAPLFLLS